MIGKVVLRTDLFQTPLWLLPGMSDAALRELAKLADDARMPRWLRRGVRRELARRERGR